MARNFSIQHLRGVDANKPALLAGELYCATDTGRIYHDTKPFRDTPVVADVDLVTQAASIAATTIFTPSITGLYKIALYLKVTRAATSSSTLGPVTLTYSDGTDSVAQSVVAQCQTQLGAAATSVATNTTVAVLTGTVNVWAVAGTAVKFAVTYASNGATTMQYEAHLKAVLL